MMAASSTIRLMVIGAGRWGRRYISTISTIPDTQLVCVASGNADTKTLVPDSCAVVPSWREAIVQDDIDGVIVATPPHTHFEIASAALSRALPLIVEKPLTFDVTQAMNLRAQAAAANVPVFVGHVHLFSPAYIRLKSELATLGPVRHIRAAGANRGPIRSDTPPMWDYAPHDIAMTLDIIAQRPSSVAAKVLDRVTTDEGVGESIAITLEFGSATRAEINVSNIADRRIRTFEASTDEASIIYDDTRDDKLRRREADSSVESLLSHDAELPLTRLVSEFVQAIRESRHMPDALSLSCEVIEILAECQTMLTGTARP